ncbi:MAG: NUDIX domain-containing protein [Clostridia bacterium]|nr:NUDIX domain-containing protein [Clostridia bacterium]
MNYCYECGTKLIVRELENEGIIPYCTKCGAYRFPIYSTAVSMIVKNPSEDKILLIKQYGKPDYVLVAGYINKGESAENAVIREVKEEIGLDVKELKFNKSEYFKPTNTLMLNFSCIAESESLAALNTDEVDFAQWFSFDDAKINIKPDSLAQRFLFSVES